MIRGDALAISSRPLTHVDQDPGQALRPDLRRALAAGGGVPPEPVSDRVVAIERPMIAAQLVEDSFRATALTSRL